MISAKYFKNQSVEVWLREKHFLIRGTSIFWNGFLNTLSWLGRGLGWQVGNGKSIHIRFDRIIGSSVHPFLPHNLIEYLMDYGITVLQDAHNLTVGTKSYWLLADDLELGGYWATC